MQFVRFNKIVMQIKEKVCMQIQCNIQYLSIENLIRSSKTENPVTGVNDKVMNSNTTKVVKSC